MVGRDGSIDWLTLPRFDSAACFAALLGGPENGHWQIAPASPAHACQRRYRDGTLILETHFETTEALRSGRLHGPPRQLRRSGAVAPQRARPRRRCAWSWCFRFEYGSIVPWVRRLDDGRLTAVAGPDRLTSPPLSELHGENMRTLADFTINAGEEIPFVLTWSASFRPHPRPARCRDDDRGQRRAGWRSGRSRTKRRAVGNGRRRYCAR